MKFCTAEEMRRLDHKTIQRVWNPGRGPHGKRRSGRGRPGSETHGRPVRTPGGGDLRSRKQWRRWIRHGPDFPWLGRVESCFTCSAGWTKCTGDARVNLQAALNMGLEVVELADESGHGSFGRCTEFDILVDAIFGTGLNSEVRGLYRDVIEMVNRSGLPVAAVDIPSGLSADTGPGTRDGCSGRISPSPSACPRLGFLRRPVSNWPAGWKWWISESPRMCWPRPTPVRSCCWRTP